MKKLIMLFLFLCIATACGNTTQSKESDPTQDQPNEQAGENSNQVAINAPLGVAPVIFYHGKYYWITGGINELPKQYIDSGDKILGIQSDDDTLPDQECYGSGFLGTNTIGHTIYINTDPNEDSIIILGETSYGVFTYYGPLEEDN